MVTSERIAKLLEGLKAHVASSDKTPWVAMTVWGFKDAPVSWRNLVRDFLAYLPSSYKWNRNTAST